MKYSKRILVIIVALASCVSAVLTGCGGDDEPLQPSSQSTKEERNFIREGNKLFEDENYTDAEVAYSKALQANGQSAVAAYNMGLAIARQAAEGDTTGLLQRADSLFNFAASITQDKALKSMAYYNMGNLGYNNQQYDKAVNDYKNALRCMPGDEDARYNLRMAQLKLQQQQQQQQNNDQNQDQQDQNKNQNQDQQQQNQDQQNQDKNQDKQDQNQDQQQGQDQQQNQDQQQGGQDKAKPEQGQGKPINMDERSVGQVLKAMEDKEKETQQKIYRMNEGRRQRERQATRNKW